jgi:hypothetical protein
MITPPNILPIFDRGRRSYQVAAPWRCYGAMIPAGFICDGASIPRLLWLWNPPDGLHRAGAVWHDWAYQNRGRLYGPHVWRITRKEADRYFREIMLASGVSECSAWLMWAGVRLGGWLAWSRSAGLPRVEDLRYSLS